LPPVDHVVPRFASGLAPRTHRVRPSEKTALRVISGFSPLGHLPLDPPRLGGAGSARPRERRALDRSISLLGHRPFVRPSVIMAYPGLASGLAMRTHRVRPSEKTAFSVVPRPFPSRQPALGPASPRRGGLRTPARNASLPPGDCPIRPPGVHLPPMIMLCVDLRPALQCGRTECVPPRKRPSASSPGLSPLGNPRWGRPRGGGAGSARPLGRLCLHRGIAPLGHQAFVCPR